MALINELQTGVCTVLRYNRVSTRLILAKFHAQIPLLLLLLKFK